MANRQNTFQDILRGVSINQLSFLFDLDRRTVTRRLSEAEPDGKRDGAPIYKISNVAQLLVPAYVSGKSKDTVESKISQYKFASLEKDYWDSKLKEQKYLENQGDLWRTEKLIEVLSMILKLFRERIVVFSDNIEHESGLPGEQIDKVKLFCDRLLIDMQTQLAEMDISPIGDHTAPVDDEYYDNDDSDLNDELRELGLI